MPRRVDRINGLLRQELSLLISRAVKDPRMSGVISITHVDTSSDLRSARVFVSVLGDDAAKQSTLQGIQSASSFLRWELRDRLALRYVPFMKFELDESIADADRLFRVMDQLQEDPSDKESPDVPQEPVVPPPSAN
jgi:ribosome-binding factor A